MPNKQLTIKLLIPAQNLSDVLELGELIEIDVVKNNKKRRYAPGTRVGTRRNTKLTWTGKNPGMSLTKSEAGAHAALTKHMAMRKEGATPTGRHIFVGIVQRHLKQQGLKPSSAQPILSNLVKGGFFKVHDA